MTAKKVIEQILSKHPKISRKEIFERLEREKKKAGGFIADDVLLRVIAAEFGVETRKETVPPTLSIQDLILGLNDVAVVGRVVAVFPAKTFRGRRSGKVASLLIVDKNSILRVVLWNDKADFVESGKVKVGDVIRFSHGYTKKGYSGRIELHLGERGEIQTRPKNVKEEDYPTISKFVTKIAEITSANTNKRVNLTGRVKEVSPASEFERKGSGSGKVMRFILVDETGETPVVVWNEKVDELKKVLKEGVGLRVVNAKVKKGLDEGLEIHVNTTTYVEKFEFQEELLKIADLKEGFNHVNVEGEVITKPMLRNVKTREEKLVKLAVFELKDETGKVWVSAWRTHADTASNLKVGDKVTIKNAYVKKGFADQPEISTRNTTSIKPLTEPTENENKTH